jgi:hypothetical protein
MKTREVRVISAVSYERKAADLVICQVCQGEEFNIYYIKPSKTPHLQCVECRNIYCDGNCEDEFYY